jgi:hypothetical protein
MNEAASRDGMRTSILPQLGFSSPFCTKEWGNRVMVDTTRHVFSSSDASHPSGVRQPQHYKNVASGQVEVFARCAQRKISPDSEPTTPLQLHLIVDSATILKSPSNKNFFLNNTSCHLAPRSDAQPMQCGPTASFQRQISSLSKPKSTNQLQKSAGGMLVLAIRAQEL